MKKLIIGLAVVGIVGAGWYLGAPLFLDNVVDEGFPEVEVAEKDKAEEEGEHEITIEAIENLTVEEVDSMPAEEKQEMQQAMNKFAQEMPDHVMDEPMAATQEEQAEQAEPADPVQLSIGTFQGADTAHKGSGQASIFELGDKSNVLRLERFSVTNGPALSVWLTKDPSGDPAAGYLDLGKLKGNIGNQNYGIPEGTDLSQYKAVSIWCVPFRVLFAHAELNN